MTRRILLVLVAIVSPLYVGVFVARFIAGRADLDGLVYAVATPSLVVGGLFLIARRRGHPTGDLMVATGLAALVVPALVEALVEGVDQGSGAQSWMWAAVWSSETLARAGAVLATALLMLLPDGRVRFPRERRYIAGAALVTVLPTLVAVSNEFVVTSEHSFPRLVGIRNELYVAALAPYGSVLGRLSGLAPLVFLGGVALLFLRYRAATERERKQLRWVLLAGSAVGVLSVGLALLGSIGATPLAALSSKVLSIASSLMILLLPVAIVVAVVEPPWIDVDIVIRRSVVYGGLSVAILVLYVGVAAALGVAAGSQLGLSVELAAGLAVFIAVIFQPARTRLQALADRWVFGQRPSRLDAVTVFGETVEHATEAAGLVPWLAETIRTVLRITWVTVSLDDGAASTAGMESGPAVIRVPLSTGGDELGEIACGRRREGRFTDDDIQLVRTLGGQLALAVQNARLAARIVDAAEAERRRIERNIHDGAQQELVALVARLAMARSAMAQGRFDPAVIDEIRLEAQQILAELRELAQGIHPSVLSDGGILEAVEDRCGRLPISVTLEASDGLRGRRFEDHIESAAYFFVSESLANVLKHADATRATVSLCYGDGGLELGVADDGRGFDPKVAGVGGIAGLRDRIRALGGTITIASGPGRGTRITASLPVAAP